jgi:hypothetical protein
VLRKAGIWIGAIIMLTAAVLFFVFRPTADRTPGAMPTPSPSGTPTLAPTPALTLTPTPVPAPSSIHVAVVWTRQFGTSNGDRALALAPDRGGDIYVTGDTQGTFPGQTSIGQGDGFLRKYDPAGEEIWTRQFGTSGGDNAWALAVDSAGNIYVAGDTEGTFPGQASGGEGDAFLRKYDPAGEEIWTRQFGTSSGDNAWALTVDSAGDIYVAGDTAGSLPGQTSAGQGDAFLRKYDPAGQEIWTRQFGTSSGDNAWALAVDSAGDICVTGDTQGTFPGQTSIGQGDAFLRKYDPAGEEIWTRQFGTSGGINAWALAVDSAGNIYVAGDTDGTFPGQASAGEGDAFLRKYDPAGEEIWTRQFGTSDVDWTLAVGLDGAGNVYVAGDTEGSLPGQASAGGSDAFLRKYDPAGEEIWTRQFGTSGGDSAWALAVDSAGNIYVAGDTEGTFPGQPGAGEWDVFLTKLGER